MTIRSATLVASLLCATLASVVSHAQESRRLLFIGDSLTYFNNGIYAHLTQLAAVARPPIVITTDKSVFGGAFLKRLWELNEPVRAISANRYDVVVLQEDLPETTVADFREYARRFVGEVRKTGARPMLLMAWAYPRLGWISMAEIDKAHREIARELKVDIAPVGLAWAAAVAARPALNLYAPDREHPSIHGTYLATCVVYAAISGRDPSGLPYVPPGMTAEEASFLQKTAWQTMEDFKKSG